MMLVQQQGRSGKSEVPLTRVKRRQAAARAQNLRLLEADFPGNVDVKEVNL